MKREYKFPVLLWLVFTGLFHSACTDKEPDLSAGTASEGRLLNIYLGVDPMTRLAELPTVDSIAEPGSNRLYNIGLYIYYTDDYNGDDLSMPYIKNMECTIEDGRLVPVLGSGEDVSNKNIYIYDEMTLVAFYPYNAEMDAVDFATKADEEQYPITRSDYSQQTYIPYRGVTTANPTNSYYVELVLYPKHTFKLEIILVSDDTSVFDGNTDLIRILPDMDPADNDNITATEGKREAWIDQVYSQPDTGGGSNVMRYVAYLWQDSDRNRVINRNDVLFQNGDFTLLATEVINVREQNIYRYGYNFSTGESFIPTSSILINDYASLQAFNGTDTHVYQVCDIDLDGYNFTPLSMINSVYDGGGHKISNLNVNATGNAGLFGQISGSSAVKNVNLIDPVITVNSSDTCFVGALCGVVNQQLTDAEIQRIYNEFIFPDNLSEVVKQALISDLLKDVFNSQSQVIACRVENPQITVTGPHPRVGTVCGGNADLDGDRFYKGLIWDTYNIGGTLAVNSGTPANNSDAYVGGFCGLNNFFITRCYTTIEGADMDAQGEETVNNNGTPVITVVDIYQGFANQGTLYTTAEGAGITDCYALAADENSGVSQLPGSWPPSSWITYTDIWPINTSGWTNYASNSFWYSIGTQGTVYPTLQWERR